MSVMKAGDERAERLAAALRENLKRRKAAARAPLAEPAERDRDAQEERD